MLKIVALQYDFVGSKIDVVIQSPGPKAIVEMSLSFATMPVEGETNGQRLTRMKTEAKLHLESAIAVLGV